MTLQYLMRESASNPSAIMWGDIRLGTRSRISAGGFLNFAWSTA